MIKLKSLFTACCIFLVGLLLIINCQPAHQNEVPLQNSSEPAVDFPHKVQAEYAEGFRISYHKNYKLLEILKPFQDQVDTLRYSLVPRKIADKVEVKNTEEIPIPVRSLIATSTTHIALTDMLGTNDVITGIVGPDYVYNKEVRQRLKKGKVTGFPMGELNKEEVLNMQPDLLMMTGGQSFQFDNYRVLMDSDINLLVNSEWLETTPLGKTEWIKVMAALLNREEKANEHFDEVKERYEELKSKVQNVDEKPEVLINLPFKGAWFLPGGNSYTAQLLKDAGADYPWSRSQETGGLRKSFEVVYGVGLRADVWLNPGSLTSKNEILTKDLRFSDFKSFQNSEIYNHYKRTTPSGGNDFWESGVVHPEIILADLIKIFHPEIVPDHKLYYYQKIE